MDLPPADLRERVAGTTDAEWFRHSGARTVDEWHRALEAGGMQLGQFPVVLDFGCGCGRALNYLVDQIGPHQRLFGMDTDADAIAWVQQNMRQVSASVLPELPPSGLADDSVDLVLSHSVFTHLTEEVQFRWLAELHRILRPGGVLVASFHGQKVIDEYLAGLAQIGSGDAVAAIRSVLDQHGFYHAAIRRDAEQSFPQYYGAAFHTIRYIALNWLRLFDLVGWHPVWALDLQDVLVLRTKKAA